MKKFNLSNRIDVQCGLNEGLSISAISKNIEKCTSSVSREIKSHLKKLDSYCIGSNLNRCVHRSECFKHDLCTAMNYLCKKKKCSTCRKFNCNRTCLDYEELKCDKPNHPPYVCNGCKSRRSCNLIKYVYDAEYANNQAISLRINSRSGISLSDAEIKEINTLISGRIINGQSVYSILASSPEDFSICARTMYRLINAGLIDARPIDMPRTVQRKLRPKSRTHKVDKKCREGRTYTDFNAYVAAHPDEAILQGDTVEGVKGGKCVLTLTWADLNFQIGFLRDHNNSASFTICVDLLYEKLGIELFSKVIPHIWLLDNGSEFSNPAAIEEYGIRIFYCDPGRPDQKGCCENTHTHIRRILPQGTSFDDIPQEFFDLLFSHINAFYRKKLNHHSPYDMFSLMYGADINIEEIFRISFINPKEVILTPKLLHLYRSSHLTSKQEVSK